MRHESTPSRRLPNGIIAPGTLGTIRRLVASALGAAVDSFDPALDKEHYFVVSVAYSEGPVRQSWTGEEHPCGDVRSLYGARHYSARSSRRLPDLRPGPANRGFRS